MIVSVCEEMNPIRRNTMEDVHVVNSPGSWGAPNDCATFLGVYDGHGGRQIADYLEDNFTKNVAKEWTHSISEQQNDNNVNRSAKDSNEKQQQKQQSKKRRLDDNTNGNGNNQLLLRNKENSDNTNTEYEKEGQVIQTALERAFLLTDIQSRMDGGITTSGATMVCCVVIPKFDNDGKLSAITIHAANAGDARAVLSSTKACPAAEQATNDNNKVSKSKSLPNPELPNELPIMSRRKAVRITHDHKSTDPKEVARIENAGGIIIRVRVLGVLAVARSLGDHGLKEYVIARPYLSSTVVQIEGESFKDDAVRTLPNEQQGKSDKSPYTNGEFLIVACDGLWDVMEDQEACDIVRSYVHKHGNESREEVSSFLIQEALKRRSTDNITVIVYWL